MSNDNFDHICKSGNIMLDGTWTESFGSIPDEYEIDIDHEYDESRESD